MTTTETPAGTRPGGRDAEPPTSGSLAGPGSAWLIVARREIMVKLTDRAFLVGSLVTMTLLIGLIGLQAFLGNRTKDYTLAADPASRSMAAAVARDAKGLDSKVRITVRDVPTDAAARATLLDGTADAWLHPTDGGWALTTKSRSQDALRSVAAQVIRSEGLRVNAAAAGTTPEALERGTNLRESFLQGDADRAQLVEVTTFVFVFLFYMAMLPFGITLATSVTEEKQSRIVEIIATAIPVRHLLAGKLAGNTVLAVVQLALWVAVGLAGLSFTQYSRLISAISAPSGWLVVFFLAGFVALSCLWAVAGALASRMEDVQSTTAPLTMLTIGIFFAGLSLSGTPQAVAAYVPPLSAVVMPVRLLQGSATWWQALISLGLLVVAAAGAIAVGERLYRRSLLQTSGRLSWRQAWRTEE